MLDLLLLLLTTTSAALPASDPPKEKPVSKASARADVKPPAPPAIDQLEEYQWRPEAEKK